MFVHIPLGKGALLQIDVCTHVKLTPLTPHPLAQECHNGPVPRQRGEHFGAGNLSAPISPLRLKSVDGAITLSFRFGIDQDLRPRR